MLGISKRTVHQRIGAGRIAPIQKMPGQTGQYLFDRAYIEQIAADERDATQRRSALAVFPAYAGMSRPPRTWPSGPRCFPRLRGDEPADRAQISAHLQFSPPTRG